jgi:5'-deoxynucleotidase YfbR-like HD superfamily hydrolase
MSSSILTNSGHRVDPFNMRASDVNIFDVAHSLSRICRYNGHGNQFYSVAQHSCILANNISSAMEARGARIIGDHIHAELAFTALLHDAPEAYIGDMPAPLKSRLPDYQALEEVVSEAVHEKFGLVEYYLDLVKPLDQAICINEMNALYHGGAPADERARIGQGLPGVSVHPVPSDEAEVMFLTMYRQLAERLGRRLDDA